MKVIYAIINEQTEKFYVGSASNFRVRMLRHLSDLRNNRHCNVYLQRSYNKYGESSFHFEVLEELSESCNLLEKEQYWIGSLSPQYNIGSVGGGDNLTNNPNREQIIQKIRSTILSNIGNMTAEERKEKWGKPGDKNPNWKGGISKKLCPVCKQKEIAPINKTCLSCRDKSGENNPFYGKKHSEATKKKLSESAKGRIPANARRIHAEGNEYPSLAAMARHYGITSGAAHYRVNSPAKQWENFFYINA